MAKTLFQSHCYIMTFGIYVLMALAISACSATKPLLPDAVHRAKAVALTPNEAQARIFFRQGDYEATLLLIGSQVQSQSLRWLAAESLFRLHRYDKARALYEKIEENDSDELERKKALIRIFESYLLSGDLKAALGSYKDFEKKYLSTSERMKYGLGKYLFDAGRYQEALPLFEAIPANSEFAMRARYLVATMGLDTRSDVDSIKLFADVAAMIPISVEDYGVKQMAILAEARLLADSKHYALAQAAYERVSLASPFAQIATAELIRFMMARAESASLGEGDFKDASLESRNHIEQNALSVALGAMERYRKSHEVGVKDPELMTLMASLLVRTRRYDEARIAFSELIDHYRPIEKKLRASAAHEKKLWPSFALNENRKPGSIDKDPLIQGVPAALLQGIPDVKKLLVLKDRIEENGRKLLRLNEESELAGRKNGPLLQAEAQQKGIIDAYKRVALAEQKELALKGADRIDKMLAEAEYKRAELILLQMRDMKKQDDVVREFQSKAIKQYEKDLEKMDKDGSS